jgi:hypothetical protein
MLYLLGGGVAIIAIYAYKTKSATPAAAVAATPVAPPVATIGGDVYPTMPVGTNIVAPAPAPAAGTNTTVTTNDAWLKQGVAFLGTSGVTGGIAQSALSLYLDGNQMSYAQGVLRDKVIAQFGLPPNLGPSGPTAMPHSPGYYRKAGTQAIYKLDATGNLTWINASDYAAAGYPAYTDLAPNDPLWKLGTISGVEAPAIFTTLPNAANG